MRSHIIVLIAILTLMVAAIGGKSYSQTMEISGYGLDSCTITYTINDTINLDGWLDSNKRINPSFSSGAVPIANISCTAEAVVGVKKLGGKLSLTGESTCDYSGSQSGAATCAKYTAVVDWATVTATSPASDDVPGSGHNSTVFASGTGVYTAHLSITATSDPANPMITSGDYTDTVIIRVGNSI